MEEGRFNLGAVVRLTRGWVRAVVVGLLGVYRVVFSAVLHAVVGPGAGCRFVPSCSRYAQEAVEVWGVRRGLFLAAGRVCRCHPWGGHGWDAVPRILGTDVNDCCGRGVAGSVPVAGGQDAVACCGSGGVVSEWILAVEENG